MLETETLVTEETLFRLPDAQRRTAVARGEHKVKGRDKSVVVYSIERGGDDVQGANTSSVGKQVPQRLAQVEPT